MFNGLWEGGLGCSANEGEGKSTEHPERQPPIWGRKRSAANWSYEGKYVSWSEESRMEGQAAIMHVCKFTKKISATTPRRCASYMEAVLFFNDFVLRDLEVYCVVGAVTKSYSSEESFAMPHLSSGVSPRGFALQTIG